MVHRALSSWDGGSSRSPWDPAGIQQSPRKEVLGRQHPELSVLAWRHLGRMGCPLWVPSLGVLGAGNLPASVGINWLEGERGRRAPGEGRRGVWSKLREIAFLLSAAAGRAAERKSVFC